MDLSNYDLVDATTFLEDKGYTLKEIGNLSKSFVLLSLSHQVIVDEEGRSLKTTYSISSFDSLEEAEMAGSSSFYGVIYHGSTVCKSSLCSMLPDKEKDITGGFPHRYVRYAFGC